MASSLSLSPPSHFGCCHRTKLHKTEPFLFVQYQIPRLKVAFRRISNYSQDGRKSLVGDPRNWTGVSIGDFNYDDGIDDEEDDDDDESDENRSLDLLVRFVQNIFRKISRRARKAVRSVLPISISTKLVGFSVNGAILLAFLWVLKAFLEVVCTLGSIVFVSILLIRGIWSGISYLQESSNQKGNSFPEEGSTWTGAQPAS